MGPDDAGQVKQRRNKRASRVLLRPPTGPYSSLSELRDRFMTLAFEYEPALDRALDELYGTSFKGNPVWLEAGGTSIKVAKRAGPLTEGRVACRVTEIKLDSIKLVGPDLSPSESPNVTPPSPSALEFAAKLLEPLVGQYDLTDAWCAKWIIDKKLLDRWAAERGTAGAARIWCAPAPLKAASFAPTVSWRPGEESRAEFVRRALTQIHKELDAFCNQVEAHALENGYIRVARRGQIQQHLSWLVRYQVKRERPADIWRSLLRNLRYRQKGELTRDAIDKAVRDTARIIGLTRRK